MRKFLTLIMGCLAQFTFVNAQTNDFYYETAVYKEEIKSAKCFVKALFCRIRSWD